MTRSARALLGLLCAVAIVLTGARPAMAFAESDVDARLVAIYPQLSDEHGNAVGEGEVGVGLLIASDAVLTAAHVVHPGCTCGMADGRAHWVCPTGIVTSIRLRWATGERVYRIPEDAGVRDAANVCGTGSQLPEVDAAVIKLQADLIAVSGDPPCVDTRESELGDGNASIRSATFAGIPDGWVHLQGRLLDRSDGIRLQEEGHANQSGSPVFSPKNRGVVGIYLRSGESLARPGERFGVALWLDVPDVRNLYDENAQHGLERPAHLNPTYDDALHLLGRFGAGIRRSRTGDDASSFDIQAVGAWEFLWIDQDHSTSLVWEGGFTMQLLSGTQVFRNPLNGATLDQRSTEPMSAYGVTTALEVRGWRLRPFQAATALEVDAEHVNVDEPNAVNQAATSFGVYARPTLRWRPFSRFAAGLTGRVGASWAPTSAYTYGVGPVPVTPTGPGLGLVCGGGGFVEFF